MKIKTAKHTDVGGRSVNEDCLMVASGKGAWIAAVADGLGGHGMGDAASALACDTAEKLFSESSVVDDELVEKIYAGCQDALIARQKELRVQGKMRTTLNLFLADEKNIYLSHIGDSRTYYFKDKQLVRRTFDHSVPQMLAAAGQISESEIRFHEDRNRLLRVLGVEDRKPAYDSEPVLPVEGGQQFLLCSDGFWELISEEQMLLCLDEAEEPGLWLENMVELVRRNGRGKSTDNATAVALWIY